MAGDNWSQDFAVKPAFTGDVSPALALRPAGNLAVGQASTRAAMVRPAVRRLSPREDTERSLIAATGQAKKQRVGSRDGIAR